MKFQDSLPIIELTEAEENELRILMTKITLELATSDIVVVFQNETNDVPILPVVIHQIKHCIEGLTSHLQYRILNNKLAPAMVVIMVKREKMIYSHLLRAAYALVHEYCHVNTVANVKRIGYTIAIDQEDCEFQCIKEIKRFVFEKLSLALAEKFWLYCKVRAICQLKPNETYNKANMFLFDLFSEEETHEFQN